MVGTVSSLLEIQNDFKVLTDVKPVVVKTMADLQAFMSDKNPKNAFGVIQYEWFVSWVFPRNSDSSDTVLLARVMEVESCLRKARVGISFDEFHLLKNPKSAINRSFSLFRHLFAYCFGATATPVMSSVNDLFYLMKFIDPRVLGDYREFCRDFVQFRTVRVKGKSGKVAARQVPTRFINLEYLSPKVKKKILSYFPKTKINFSAVTARMSEATEKVYVERASGVCAGGVKQHSTRLLDLQYCVNASPEKMRLFREYVGQNVSSGILVYVAYYETLSVLESVLKVMDVPYDSITGDKTSKKRLAAKEWFVRQPENKVLFLTRAGGQSLNLQATNKILFYDIPLGVGNFIQTMGRVVRHFSEFNQFDITFAALEETVDAYKYELVTAHRELIEKMFNNETVPEGAIAKSFEGAVLARLRNAYLWKR